MKTIKILCLLFFFVVAGFGQEMTVKEMNGFLEKAAWEQVTKGIDEVPYFVDTSDMTRIGDIVLFRLRTDQRRGTITYNSVGGNCSTNKYFITNGFVLYAGETKIQKIVDSTSEILPAKSGTVIYFLLDYVCANSKKSLDK